MYERKLSVVVRSVCGVAVAVAVEPVADLVVDPLTGWLNAVLAALPTVSPPATGLRTECRMRCGLIGLSAPERRVSDCRAPGSLGQLHLGSRIQSRPPPCCG
jgi:hypothetical protein